jgi:hypothetical protein
MQDFKLGGRQKIIFFPIAEGGAKIFGVFRVKNHDFTPKNLIFSNFRGGAPAYAKCEIFNFICILFNCYIQWTAYDPHVTTQ